MAVLLAAWLLALSADVSAVLGEWTGDSQCVGERPACVDEHNVYVMTRSRACRTMRLHVEDAYLFLQAGWESNQSVAAAGMLPFGASASSSGVTPFSYR